MLTIIEKIIVILGEIIEIIVKTMRTFKRRGGKLANANTKPNPDLVGREFELEVIKEALENKNTQICVISAWGGVGKTLLADTWRFRTRNKHKSITHYKFKFSHQEETVGSCIYFFKDICKVFGITFDGNISPRQIGLLIANAISQKKIIIILDGLESLQYPSGFDKEGEIRDEGIKFFLEGLNFKKKGLCLVTTRYPIQKQDPRIVNLNLDNLSEEACKELLNQFKLIVKNDKELITLINVYQRHALSLFLVGQYIEKSKYYGNVGSFLNKIESINDTIVSNKRFNDLINMYEIWLGSDKQGKESLSLLYYLALFDRKVSMQDLKLLVDKSQEFPISNIDSPINPDTIDLIISNLLNLNLIQQDVNDLIDCHPLVRAYFFKNFQDKHNESRINAQNILFKHYLDIVSDHPDTIEKMEPLYWSIFHGCQAGQLDNAIEIFKEKIRRKDKHFSLFQLCLVFEDLYALSNFLSSSDRDNTSLKPGLTKTNQAYILNEIGSLHRIMGNPSEGIPPALEAYEIREKLGEEKYQGGSARNLSKLYFEKGELKKAEKYADIAISISKMEDNYDKYVSYANKARVLHFMGEYEESQKCFLETMRIRKLNKDQEKKFTLQETHYCDLLIDLNKLDVVKETLDNSEEPKKDFYLDFGLYHYSYGKYQMSIHDYDEAISSLYIAIDSLEKAQRKDELGFAYITRAYLFRNQKEWDNFKCDMKEIQSIINDKLIILLIEFKILETHYEIEFHGKFDIAKKHINQIHKLIKQTGYNRINERFELLNKML